MGLGDEVEAGIRRYCISSRDDFLVNRSADHECVKASVNGCR